MNTPFRRGPVPTLFVAMLAAAYPLMVFGAALPKPWLFMAGAAASYLAEWYVHRFQRFVVRALSKVNVGVTLRVLIRDSMLIVFIARLDDLRDAQFVLFTLGVLGVHALRFVHNVLTYRIQRRRPPVELVNVPRPHALPTPAPEWLIRDGTWKMLQLDVLPVAGTCYGALDHHYLPLVIFSGVAIALGLVVCGVLAAAYRRISRVPADTVFKALHEQVVSMRPEVVLYFSGSPDSAYQLNMWLRPIEQLRHNTLILLRERAMLTLAQPTSTPMVCITNAVDLMNFSLPDVRLALYVANVGKNIHLLRVPGIRHVFIGHGDSDKQASVNPFSKVYDEVWVAGPAGRERWARADVGVRDECVREVGRPQLDPIQVVPAGPSARVRHVLYAPTWEGWTNDPYHTSLVLMGPDIVRAVLAAGADVTLTYKPHPLTGTRDREALRTHERIVHMIRVANRHRPSSAEHAIVIGPTPSLYQCFNNADLLISDISSVVADFIQSEKPYVTTNPANTDDAEFRLLNPTVSAGYLISPQGPSIDDVLQAIADGDPLEQARRRHKRYLLGPDRPSPMERFVTAVDEVVAQGVPAPSPEDLEFAFEPEPDTDAVLGNLPDGEGEGGAARLVVR